MLESIILPIIFYVSTLLPQQNPFLNERFLGEASISLNNRQPNSYVNSVFKDNILLNLAYLRGDVKGAQDISWDRVNAPFEYQFTLSPGEVFAYHEDSLPEYQGRVIRTTNTHFNAQEGYKFSGLLFGDGVCHLASLINKASKKASLSSISLVSHDFAQIPEIEREYGASIFYAPGQKQANSRQNLYVENTKDAPVEFKFNYDGNNLKLSIYSL